MPNEKKKKKKAGAFKKKSKPAQPTKIEKKK